MNALAVVLARAGSKGVPGKNVAPVGGRPCVAWTIEAALSAREVERVVLSTDDPRAAEVARGMGVDVVERPADLAGDLARVDDAARHAVAEVERHRRLDARTPIVVLYGNVPIRPEGLIDRAVVLMRETGCDSVQSYAPVGKHHPWWTVVVGDRGEVGAWDGGELFHGCYRRQDLPPAHGPDGGVMVVSRESLMVGVPGASGPHGFLGRSRRGVVNPEGSVVDIDSRYDLLVADAMLRDRLGLSRVG